MPRITKTLPPDRADYTFGDLVYWHLFKFGTRPAGDPSDQAGRLWNIDAICTLLDITPRTLRNWIADKHLPDAVAPLSMELFGNNKRWDEARLELQDKFEKGWAAKRPSARPPQPVVTSADEAVPSGIEAAAGDRAEEVMPGEGAPKPSEGTGNQEEASPSRAIQITPPVPLRPHGGKQPWPGRISVRALVAALLFMFGIFGWMQVTRKADRPAAPQQKTAAQTEQPKALPPSDSEKTAREIPAVQPPSPPVTLQPPPAPSPPPEVQISPPPIPTDEEKPTAEERLLAEKLIAARQAAHDAEMLRHDEEARHLDEGTQEAINRQREREKDARAVAGVGYRLRENTSVAGSSFANLLTDNITDCALACMRQNCDAFAYYRDQYGPGSRRSRYCYLYRKPFITANNPGYALGEPVADPPSRRSSTPATSPTLNAPVQPAQAAPPTAPPAVQEGVIRCAGGPVKVTGFKLACDRILSGGTTLGSARLSYTVANINECAAKCRAVARCVAFTFNSGDPDGQHACMIFGPTPETRESAGWISGVR